MKRQEVLQAINSEREYQDTKWGKVDDPNYVSYHQTQFLVDLEIHLNKAKQAAYNVNWVEVMNEFRKIGALAVKCGEVHNMPERK